MLSNNAGEQIAAAAAAAQAAGTKVVTWDSPIPSGKGEDLFVAQVDFDEIGKVMADMALSILGPDGGEFAILSARPDSVQPERLDRGHARRPSKDPSTRTSSWSRPSTATTSRGQLRRPAQA